MAIKKMTQQICRSCFVELDEQDVVDINGSGDLVISVTGSTDDYLVTIYDIVPSAQCEYDH